MALSERLQYILDFNTTGAVKSLQTLGSAADKELGKAESKLDKLSSNLTKFGTGAVAFAGVAGAGLVKLASGAAEAEANTAALRQVVDEVAATEIEEWALGSAEAVGLASKEAIAATTGFAGLGKIIGLSGSELTGFSTGLVEMAANMAAFKDVDPQQALQDLQSLFAGSTEVGRKYNIFLDDATLKSAYFRETGEQVSGTLTAQQRIIATNSELYRQGADMIGQWGRESGGLAGQQAQLRANLINLGDAIGKGALPMLTQLVGGLNKGVTAFSKLDPGVQSAIGKFSAMGVAGIGLIGALSAVAGQVIKLRDRFTTLDKATDTRSLNNFGKAAAGLGVALGAAGLALAAYSYEQQQQAQAQTDLIAGFRELSRVTDEQVIASLQELMAVSSLPGLDNLDSIFGKLVKTNIEVAKRILESGAAAGLGAEALTKLSVAVKLEEAARARAAKTTEEHGEAVEEATVQTGHASAAERDYVNSLIAANQEVDANQRALEGANWYIRKQADEAADASSEIDNLRESHVELREELADRSAYLDLQDAFDKVETAAVEAYTAASEGSEDAEQKTRDFERAQIDLKQRILDYLDSLEGIPPEVASDIVALIDEGKLAEAEAKLLMLTRQRYADVLVRVSGGGRVTNDGNISFTPGAETAGAEGGIINRPTVLLAGEAGPEALIPLHRSPGNGPLPASLMGSGSLSVPASSPGAIREAARRMLREEIERYFAEAR